MATDPRLRIERQAATDAACALLAQAMRDNPTHIAVFGPDAPRRQRRLHAFFSAMLPWLARNGRLFGALVQGRLEGVFGMLPPAHCQPRGVELWRLGLALLRGQPLATQQRMMRWLLAWRRNDSPEAHWHLGPLAVRPASQGQGVGSALLRHGLAIADATPALCHLETDLPRNVRLYQSLGFAVVSQQTVLGVPNWFMQRPPTPQESIPSAR